MNLERHVAHLIRLPWLVLLHIALNPEPIHWEWPSFRSAFPYDWQEGGL